MYSTGWFGHNTTFSKVHVVFDGHPICGSKLDARMMYQWCTADIHVPYIECGHCLKKAKQILKERHEKKMNQFSKRVTRKRLKTLRKNYAN